jgi:hypothetical protein
MVHGSRALEPMPDWAVSVQTIYVQSHGGSKEGFES